MAGWRVYLVAAGLLLACASARAGIRLRAATLDLPGIQMADVSASIMPGPDGSPVMQFDAAKASIPALGWHGVRVALAGAPERSAQGVWKFAGHAATRGAPGDALHDATVTVELDRGGGTLEVDVLQGKSSLHALMPLDQTTHVQMTLGAIPLAWLRGVLAASWPAGRITTGIVAGNVALDLAKDDTRVSGRVNVTNAGLDSKTGSIAAQKLGADGTFLIDTGRASVSMMFDGRLAGGQVLLGPLYARLPQNAVGVHVAGTLGKAGVKLTAVDFDDPDALRLSGSLAFDRRGKLQDLDLTRFAATFPAAYQRYGTTLVQGLTGFTGLATAGSIAGTLDMQQGRLQALTFKADHVSLGGAGNRLAVSNLDGALDWHAGESRPATQLRWNGLSLYRLAFGPARMGLRDTRGVLRLRAPVSVAVLGGALQVQRFAWQPGAGHAQTASAALSLTGVDVNQLCKALGWPNFGGQLAGAVPDMSYRNGTLAFDGGLSLDVFGGSVSITHLSIRHLFGNAPGLAADIDLQQLDMAPLTGAFGFGQITGRLDGSIDGLQLTDWKPTAFNASLKAYGGGKISQNAIKSLTEVGGGGIIGGIQGLALRLFKTFDYSKIGLTCTLAHGVCTMGGIVPDPDPDGSGYTIVQGSGLPHITVIGHERSVDWATLVSRLKAATAGKGPVIRG